MATETSEPTAPSFDSALFWERNKMPILAAVLILVLAGLGYGGYLLYKKTREDGAAKALAQASAAPDFRKVIDDFSGTAAAGNAHLLLAGKLREEKKFEESNATLQAFLTRYPKHQLDSTARMTMAHNLEALGKKEEALTTLQKLTTEQPRDFNTPLALLEQGNLFKELNKPEEARRVYENMMAQHADSPLAQVAQEQMRSLPPPPAPPVPAPAVSVAPAPQAAVPSQTAPSAPAASPASSP